MTNNILLFLAKNPCEDITILQIFLVLKEILKIVFLLVPIILIILVMIDLAKNVIAGKEDDMKKNKNLAIKRIIYAIAIFFVPTIVSIFMNAIGDIGIDYSSCMSITKETLAVKLANGKNNCTSSDKEWNEALNDCVEKKRYTKIELTEKTGYGDLGVKKERDVSNNNYEPDDNTGTGDYTGQLGLPLGGDSIRISSKFGPRTSPCSGCSKFHRGLDLSAGDGTKIYAIDGGEVVVAQWNKYRGNYIVIKHDENFYSFYQHCSKLLLKVGDKADKGMIIAYSGHSGVGTGPHLHFELSKSKSGGEASFDPCSYKGYSCSGGQLKLK